MNSKQVFDTFKRLLLPATLLLVGCSAAEESDPGKLTSVSEALVVPAADSVAKIPSDYVLTPNGYFHRSCVVELSADEVLQGDRTVHNNKSGKSYAIPRCDKPRLDARGRAISELSTLLKPSESSAVSGGASAQAANPLPPPSFSGWIESGSNDGNGPLNWISANFKVPTNPAMTSTQTLYYFPGIQPLIGGTAYTIMQPVLRYYGGAWDIASWNCCAEGTTVQSPWVHVNSGDTLYGYVQGDVCDANGLCSQWKVYTGDWTNGASSNLNTSSWGSIMGWAFGGVLESYDIDDCAEFPASGGVNFYNLQVRNTKYQTVYPTWNASVTGASPQCGYGIVSPNTSSVTVKTTPVSRPAPAASSQCGTLFAGQGLTAGQSLASCDGRFRLTMQTDGNLVLKQGSTTLWSSGTAGRGGYAAEFMSGGALRLWSATSQPVWSTNTSVDQSASGRVSLQNDGNLVLYDRNDYPLWASNTCCH